MNLLVTGGSGRLGRALVPRLEARGHVVRAPRRPALDLATGAGLREALDGVEAVVHCASAPFRDERGVDVEGTARLVAACGDRHVVYPSIVGIDRVPTSYYRSKLAAETELSRAPHHTIVRLTQFHSFIGEIAAMLAWCWPVVPVPVAPIQPIDVGDAAAVLVEHVEAGPIGRAVDVGGPEVLEAADLVRRWVAATARRRCVVALPLIGTVGRGLAAGGLTCPDGRRTSRTYDQWLADRRE